MKINKTWMCMLVAAGSLLVAGVSVKAEPSADKQLQKGIEAYQQNDHDEALDCFIDVLMNGDSEQVAQANKYIDAIHNKIGGIKQPVEVDVSFPDQPIQTVLTSTDTWAKQGAQNAQALSNQANQTAQNAVDALNTAPLSLTEQIEQRQLAEYTQQGMQPITAAQGAVLDDAVVLSNQAANGAAAVRNDLNAVANQYNQQANQYGQQAAQYGQQLGQQVNQYGQQINQYGQQVGQQANQLGQQAVQQVNQYGQQLNQYGQQTVGQLEAPMDDMYRLANDYELQYPGYQSAVPATYQDAAAAGAATYAAAQQTVNATPNAVGATDTYISPNLSPAAYDASRSRGGFTAAPDYYIPASSSLSSSQTQDYYNSTLPANNATAVSALGDGSAFTDLTSPAAVEARNLYTAQKLQSMRDGAIAALTAEKGVHLYLRPDGRPDAIDIDDGVLFQGSSFRQEAFGTLNNIYELLALTQGTRYIILPAGSYTDDVTLSGIRQAMALKSYLTKRGISQGKLYYNMGLVDQEVPTQFSNLKGLSIVFDYDANLPTRLLENAENETAPLLSMAIVPPCHAIDRSLGEAYAVDFSVLETVNPINNWVLQVVQHGRNGNYYIVRQLEGFGPVYHQILWNGRKGIIGPELPCGKYTLVLTGVDSAGNKKVLRRRVVVKCAGAATMGSCETGTCTKKEKASSTASNYKAARLWNKPGRVMHCVAGCLPVTQEEEEVAAVQEVAPVATEAESTVTSSTSSGTYTKTETVRNVVVDDTSSQTDTVASSVDTGYAPMPSNAGGYVPATGGQYEAASYEEEYTSY